MGMTIRVMTTRKGLLSRASGVLAAIFLASGACAGAANAAPATQYNTPSISWTSCSASQLTTQNGCPWAAPFDPVAGQMGYTANYTSNTQAQWDNYYYCDTTYWAYEN